MLRRLLTLIVIICLLGTNRVSVHAQQAQTARFFSESGHNVGGDFLKFYEANPNAIFLYGYPITEEFQNKDGRAVQYFQRARFEYWPELEEGRRVVLTPLGHETYTSSGPIKAGNDFSCRAYPQTGFSVCFAFLEFFDQYGGVTQFGYPISGFEYHENRLVQYFEKARLEWQPWKLEGQRVAVSDLGRIYFDKLREDPALLAQVRPLDNTIQVVTSLQVRAFVQKAVTLSTDTQQVYLVVRDQALQPAANARCAALIHWAGGRAESIPVSVKANGMATVSFSFTNQAQGSLVNIDVTCSSNNLTAGTKTSFRIWY